MRGVNRFGKMSGSSYIAYAAEQTADENQKKRERYRVAVKQRYARLDKTYDYRMTLDGNQVGPVITMTGWDAKERNVALEKKFMRSLDQGKPGARLWKWCIAKQPSAEKRA